MTPRFSQQIPSNYTIKVRGFVSQRIADNIGLSVKYQEESERMISTLSGRVVDQAALMGILNNLYVLGFTLITVETS